MANMIIRTIAPLAELALGTTYLWGHTGSGPASDRRFLVTNFLTKDTSGVRAIPDEGSDEKLRIKGANSYISFLSADGLSRRGYLGNFSGNTYIWNDGAGAVIFGLSGAESARFTDAGNLALGRNSAIGSSRLSVERNGSAGAPALSLNHTAASGTRYLAAMYISGVEVGNITSTGTTTAYNTSSDYRLKDDIEDLTGSGEFIDGLRPRRWISNINGEIGVGFVAHEFAEVSPSSVHGEKDAMQMRPVFDPDTGEAVIDEATGEQVVIKEPSYQSMQASSPEVMAHLILEVQSLRARTAQLEERLADLEG